MKILITGGSGFLGSALALQLCKRHDVALLLRTSSSLRRLGERAESRFRIGRCDTDLEVTDFVRNVAPDAVIHTACSYGRNGESLLQISDANVRFGLLVLEALIGITDEPQCLVPFLNTGTVLGRDVSAYAMSKHQLSDLGKVLALRHPSVIRFVDVALQHMYGPGDDTSKFSTFVLQSCMRDVESLNLTAGEQARDFIYIDDVVSAYETLLNAAAGFEPYRRIDVGSGDALLIKDFVTLVRELTGARTKLNFGALPYREGDATLYRADISDMKSLGWLPAYDLRAGLKRTIEQES